LAPSGWSVPEYLKEFDSVFSKESFDALPESKKWDHTVELIPEEKASNCKVYLLAPTEQKELDQFLKENLETGQIHLSKSLIASPVFFIKKKDRTLRLVQDYRALNAMTVKNKYLLPLISVLINKLRGAKYFTKLDVQWGFNNVQMKEGDEWKAAFRTNRGLFEPLVMFFGLCVMVRARSCSFQRTIKGQLRQSLRLWLPHHCSVPRLPPATVTIASTHVRFTLSFSLHSLSEQHATKACSSIFTIPHA